MAVMPTTPPRPSTPVKAPAVWAMFLPPRTGAVLADVTGVIDTRRPEYAAVGSAAGLIPGLYAVKGYTTKAGDRSAHVTAAHPATDAALKVRQAERRLAQAQALLAGAPELPGALKKPKKNRK